MLPVLCAGRELWSDIAFFKLLQIKSLNKHSETVLGLAKKPNHSAAENVKFWALRQLVNRATLQVIYEDKYQTFPDYSLSNVGILSFKYFILL